MKSPFPGMDPYIEACDLWADFHHDLITEIKHALARTAPERYFVRAGERSYLVLVESEGKASHPFIPDVSISTPRTKGSRRPGTAVAEPATNVEPVTMRAFIEEEHREAFVEIYEAAPEKRLVTTVEVLSPSNKRANSTGRDIYQRKRQSLLLSDTNLVEIDLLRGGERMPMLDSWPSSPYTLLVARARKPYACKVWPAHFQRSVPRFPFPWPNPIPTSSSTFSPLSKRSTRSRDMGRVSTTPGPSIHRSRPMKPAG
jgi:Protein of unknown function (DUF4058)